MNISDFLLTTPAGMFIVGLSIIALAIVAWGSTGNGRRIPRWRIERVPPTPEAPRQSQPTATEPEQPPAPPKREPEPAAPKAEPDQPCAKERQEIEELTKENERLKKPQPLKKVTEANVSHLLAEFGKINSKGERDLRYEAEQSEPNIERVMGFLRKFETHLGQTGYDAPTPERLMKLLWDAAKAYRQKNPR